MKILVAVLFLIMPTVSVIAQEQRNDVELPSFVITGKASEQFVPLVKPGIAPVFLPLEGLTLSGSTSTFKISKNFEIPFEKGKVAEKDSTVPNVKNVLQLSAGNVRIPDFRLHYNSPFSDGKFSFGVKGFNSRDFVENATEYRIAPEALFKVSIGDNIGVPYTDIRFAGSGFFHSFNFYGLKDSNFTVKSSGYAPSVTLSSTANKTVWLHVELKGDFLSVPVYNLSNTGAVLSSDLSLGGTNFRINAGVDYTGGTGGYNNSKTSYGLFEAYSDVLLQFTSFRLRAGAYFADNGSASYFNPTIRGELPFGSGVSIHGGYGGKTEILYPAKIYQLSKYISVNKVIHPIQRYEHTISAGISVVRKKLLDIHITGKLSTIPSHIAVRRTAGIAGLTTEFKKASQLLFKGVGEVIFENIGTFSGTVQYNRLADTDGNIFPYSPLFSISGYLELIPDIDWKTGLGIEYHSGSFTDFSNTEKTAGNISPYITIGYNVQQHLEVGATFSNLINRKNELPEGFRLPGFEVNLQFRYVW